MHILMNTISIMFIVSRFEKLYKVHLTLAILVAASITGTFNFIQVSC